MLTCIEYGGGPTIEQRREFCGLVDGTQKPGITHNDLKHRGNKRREQQTEKHELTYTGYLPQVKYRVGKTFGKQTAECAKSFPHVTTTPEKYFHGKPPLKNILPESGGDVKYTKSLKSGYSGFVPRVQFRFGGTYSDLCDVAIDEHMTRCQKREKYEVEMRQVRNSFPTMQVLNFNPHVRDHLNTYRDTHPLSPILHRNKRGPLEPPIPGYTGLVPRIHSTQVSLGCNNYEGCDKGLKMFDYENCVHFSLMNVPVNPQHCPSATKPIVHPPAFKRTYLPDGMIPNYAGHVPYVLYDYGRNYGDMTRRQEECLHEKESYAEYMKVRVPPNFQIIS